jgi:hypothetical protein
MARGLLTGASMPRLDKISLIALISLFAAACDERSGPEDATDTGTDTDTEGETDTGDPPPAQCQAVDPEVSAEFSVDLGDWSPPDLFLGIDLTCTIDAMALEAGTYVHALTCDDAGTPRSVTLRVAASDVGPVQWAAADVVRLAVRTYEGQDYGIYKDSVQMWAADATPLLIGYRGAEDAEPIFAPLTLAEQFPCGAEDWDGPQGLPFELVFGFGGQSVGVVHGQRAVLPIDDAAVFAIDVADATANYCCHYAHAYHALIRRVTPQ